MNQVLIVGINGSPNVKGNTAFMLETALEAARNVGSATEIVNCQRLFKGTQKIFCTACSTPCTGKCYEGKALQDAYSLISLADGLLVGSPVYFGSISGQLKAFWDKTRLLRNHKRLLNKVGGALAVGSSRFGGQETTLRAIHDIFLVHGMLIIGDGYHEDDCGHMGAAAQRPAQADQEALKRCRIIGKRIFQVAKATRGLRQE